MGQGLLRAAGAEHLRQRRLVQPAFLASSIEGYRAVFTEEAARRFGALADHSSVDFHRELVLLTLAIVGRTFFSLDLSRELERLGDAVATAIETLAPGSTRLAELWRRRRFRKALKIIDELLFRLIDETGGSRADVVSRLASSRDDEGDGSAMTPRELRDELVTLLIAGHETTASALSWAVYALARDPVVQERVARDPRLARGAFAEAMRIYPPAWILFRRVLGDYTVAGVTIPKGAHLAISPYLAGRDPRWFSDPMSLRPERWSEPSDLERQAFFPFGLGNRRCLGESFAWEEGTAILTELLRRFRLELPAGASVTEAPLFTLRPAKGLPIRVTAR